MTMRTQPFIDGHLVPAEHAQDADSQLKTTWISLA